MAIQTTDRNNREYIYGPVPSGRLGCSLGVDLVPFKTCTYDCIYCQLGRTTNKTIEREQWVPVEIAIDQLRSKLDFEPDYITLSGSGEPTLFSQLGLGVVFDNGSNGSTRCAVWTCHGIQTTICMRP